VTNSGDKTHVWNEHEKISVNEGPVCRWQSTGGVWRSQRRSIMWMRFLSRWQYCCRLNTPKVLNQIFIRWYIQMTNPGVMFVKTNKIRHVHYWIIRSCPGDQNNFRC
jgi:hypothetical protein